MIYLCPNTILDDAAKIEGETKNATKGPRHLSFRPPIDNLIAASDRTDFTSNWTGVGLNVTNNYAYAPGGEKVAARLVASASTNAHDINYTIGTDLSGKWLRLGVLVRYVNYDDFSLAEPQSTVNDIRYDIGANSLHSANNVEDYEAIRLGDGWYWLEVAFDGDAATQKIQLRMTNGDSALDWTAAGTEEVWIAHPYAGLYSKKFFSYSTADTDLAADKLILSGVRNQLGRGLRVQTDASYDPKTVLSSPSDKHDWNGAAFGDYKCAKFTKADSDYFRVLNANLDTIDTYTTIDWWVAGWVRVDTDNYCEYINRWAAGDLAFFLGSNTGGGVFYFGVNDGTSTTQLNSSTVATADPSRWYFICAYHENGVGIGISINGTAFDTAAHTGGVRAATAHLMMNRQQAAGTYSNQSMMCWCTGTGLLGTKGRDYLYNSGTPLLYSELTDGFKTHHQLVSYWNMTEESGNRADSHGSNTLEDINTVSSDCSMIKSDTGALSLYSSSWVAGGLNNDDIVLSEAITGQDAISITVDDGAAATTTAYTNQISKFYASDSMSFGSPVMSSVRIEPNWSTLVFKGKAYKVRETAEITFEYVTQTQVDEIQDHDRLLNEPIYVYDDGGNVFVDKIWHCVLSDVEFVEQDNDYFLMRVSLHRLREYV